MRLLDRIGESLVNLLPFLAQRTKTLTHTYRLQVHQLEIILDSLVDEKDRYTQKRGEGANGRHVPQTVAAHASTNSASDGSSQLSLEISISRPAEIEAALQQFVSPKVTRAPNEIDHATNCPDFPKSIIQ